MFPCNCNDIPHDGTACLVHGRQAHEVPRKVRIVYHDSLSDTFAGRMFEVFDIATGARLEDITSLAYDAEGEYDAIILTRTQHERVEAVTTEWNLCKLEDDEDEDEDDEYEVCDDFDLADLYYRHGVLTGVAAATVVAIIAAVILL